MPRLRKYVDGNGFFLTDYLHGVGHCTWQIGDEGLDYLNKRGVRAHGDQVGVRERTELQSRGWIWVTGPHLDRQPPGTVVLPADLRPLAEVLTR